MIGGTQAGLSVGYYLAQRGERFVILDAYPNVGDAWRTRWDSLRVFTPAKYDGLPRFPVSRVAPPRYPTKDEMGDYLEAYANRFDLPVRTGVGVRDLGRDGDRYVITAGDRRFEADNVVVATGASRVPATPSFAGELSPEIVQLHSSDYRNPSQLGEGRVLLVGSGNSGAEIAFELSATRPTWVSGPSAGTSPIGRASRRGSCCR